MKTTIKVLTVALITAVIGYNFSYPMDTNIFFWGGFIIFLIASNYFLERNNKKEKRRNIRMLTINTTMFVLMTSLFISDYFINIPYIRQMRWSLFIATMLLYPFIFFGLDTIREEKKQKNQNLKLPQMPWIKFFANLVIVVAIGQIFNQANIDYLIYALTISIVLNRLFIWSKGDTITFQVLTLVIIGSTFFAVLVINFISGSVLTSVLFGSILLSPIIKNWPEEPMYD